MTNLNIEKLEYTPQFLAYLAGFIDGDGCIDHKRKFKL